MSYGNGGRAISSCEPDIEDVIVKLRKDVKIDNGMIKAMNKFMDHNGDYIMRDLQMNIAHSEIIINRRNKKRKLKKLIAKQMASRQKLRSKKPADKYNQDLEDA